eukprot:6414844-Pyramimonas_sp.AAC.1
MRQPEGHGEPGCVDPPRPDMRSSCIDPPGWPATLVNELPRGSILCAPPAWQEVACRYITWVTSHMCQAGLVISLGQPLKKPEE